jgi:hypothetical protein
MSLDGIVRDARPAVSLNAGLSVVRTSLVVVWLGNERELERQRTTPRLGETVTANVWGVCIVGGVRERSVSLSAAAPPCC